MREINYKQDFSIWERLLYRDPETREFKEMGFPPYDFKIRYYTTSLANAYEASCRWSHGEPKCVNCKCIGGKLLVIFDRHHLQPGVLKGEIEIEYPSHLYPDGFRNDPIELNPDVRLVHGGTTSPSRIESEVILPYIMGKDGRDGRDGADGRDGQDGKDFSYEDMTDEQKEELASQMADKAMGDIDEKVDEAIKKKLGEEFTELGDIPEETFEEMFKE